MVQYLYAILFRLGRTCLQVGLVDLDHISACSKRTLDLFIDRCRIVHSELYLVFIEIVLRLLSHCEWTGHRNLDHAVGIGTQERHIADLDWMAPPYPADNTRHGIRMSAAIQCGAGIVDVDAF